LIFKYTNSHLQPVSARIAETRTNTIASTPSKIPIAMKKKMYVFTQVFTFLRVYNLRCIIRFFF
jgi:hypothetical protein